MHEQERYGYIVFVSLVHNTIALKASIYLSMPSFNRRSSLNYVDMEFYDVFSGIFIAGQTDLTRSLIKVIISIMTRIMSLIRTREFP